MPTFPSQGWIEAFCDRLAKHPRASHVAESLDGVYRFVVTPAGPLTAEHAYDVEIRPSARGPRVRPVTDGAPQVTLTADFDRWRQLITGELDIAMAVMLRRVKIAGDVGTLVRNPSSAGPLLDALGQVDTQWPTESR